MQFAEVLASCEHEPTTIMADVDFNQLVERRCVLVQSYTYQRAMHGTFEKNLLHRTATAKAAAT
jgi:hypothetical protein